MVDRMSSRADKKATARQHRLQREEEARRADARRHNRRLLAVIAVAAISIVATAVYVATPKDDPVTPAAAASSHVAGIPQDGITLGSPSAPATLVEFADPQCPYCADYSNDVLPTVIDRYVRTNQLKLELHVLTFVGEDSVEAGRMAGAAAEQDRLWNFSEAFFAVDGEENSGYVTDELLREVGTAAGLDVDRAMSRRDDVDLEPAQETADRFGIESTPSFVLVKDGKATPVALEELTPAAFTQALDEALAQ
jgi:protein-disulfide isomerase